MGLGNGLGPHDNLDDRMREYVENIRFLSGEVAEKNSEIRSTEETLNDLQAEGLSTPELEQSFSSAIQKTLNEKAELEKKRETIMSAATQELNEAKEEYGKNEDKIKVSSGSQGAEILKAIRERVIAIGEWEKELRDVFDDNDDPPPPPGPVKRLVLRR